MPSSENPHPRKQETVPSDIEQAVKSTITEMVGTIGESEITPEKELVKDLGFDSLHSVELYLKLEKKLGIRIPDDLLEAETRTVGDLIETIKSVIANQRRVETIYLKEDQI